MEVGSVADSDHSWSWATSRYLWDSRQAPTLRVRCGGGERAPYFNTDGTLAALPTADPGHSDPAARTEWLTVLQERGEFGEVFAAAGLRVEKQVAQHPRWPQSSEWDSLGLLRTWPFVFTTFADEVRRLAAWDGREVFSFPSGYYGRPNLVDVSSGVPVLRRANGQETGQAAKLPHSISCRLPDLDLVRAGLLKAHELHPLVRESLFPDLPAAETQPRYEITPVRVRCRGEWHVVEPRDGVLSGPHAEQEHRREQALQALGGAASGCYVVRTAWANGGKLPKQLRALRKEIFGRARHGDTGGLIELLDAGIDVRVRDSGKRGLLHYIHLLDHDLLLRRLLDMGLDLEAVDHAQRTPLYTAVSDGGSAAVVRALLEAGARPDVMDEHKISLAQRLERNARGDLRFLFG
ncbi:ankyrin repeat domain-containing protein [Kibdelosporangium phytohabitans]|uniref:Uncharacterized protein n=1 Tax=Kibdelosporangium phytohabitans TaxID=860235 RepID=A0A0N9IAL9_9PSEU|nr:ankyrin repeat domain-containing protein [Kibdelosporangium phytohabitans]ALG13412.1 hypothetical protein AOZ06_46990 [Kibdelosporangium phytohabitans]MBE1465216.1 hypothetical protein [Kibdelosporangium phytohabitans]